MNTSAANYARLHLPKGGLGREYVVIQLYLKDKGPFDFVS